MSIPTDPISDSSGTAPTAASPAPPAPPRMAPTRPMYWSIRRELWENRSVTLAPLAVTAFVLLIMLSVTAAALPRRIRSLQTIDTPGAHALVGAPFRTVPAPIIVVTILVGLFYCLDALYGERRDRSILFWKSLPVSDVETVLSKAAIPLVVLPVIGLALSLAAQLILLVWSTIVLAGNGMSTAPFWADVPVFQVPLVMIYGVTAFTLWHAPIYGWLLVVSAWAKRMPVLWATVPFVVLSILERMAFGTAHFSAWMRYRFVGAMQAAFDVVPATNGHMGRVDRLSQLDPVKFLGTAGLWFGLIFTVGALAAAVRLRRDRQPL